MKLYIFKLKFNTPLHIGDERSDYDNSSRTIHSDTLYAALTACIGKVGGIIPDNGDLGFTVSSLFPYYQKEATSKPIYFFPKSKQVLLPKEDQLSIAKKLKKVQWLDTTYFQRQLDGENLFQQLNNNHIQGSFLSQEVIPPDFISTQVQNRVAVPRYGIKGHTEDAEPFYMERLFFQDHSGFFFIATGNNISLLRKALKILEYEGIGTDRTVGNGFFTYEEDTHVDFSFQIPESDKAINLSLFAPNPAKASQLLNDVKVAYEIQRRGGWITKAGFNTYRKNAVYMFAEGSILKNEVPRNKIFEAGEIHNLKPEVVKDDINHPIWRSGKALFIPIKTV